MEKKVTGRRIARLAWGSLFSAVRAMPLIFLAGLALLAALEIGAGYLSSFLPRTALIDPLFTAIQAFGQLAVVALVQVAMHRFILLGESGANLPIIVRFAAWMIPFYLLRIVVDVAGFLSGQSLETVATVLYWANWILLVWILLLFPAVAIGEESDGPVKRVETAIRRGRGYFWLFIRSLLMTLVPLFLALLVIVLAINATQTSPNAAAITPVTLWLIQAGWWAILVVTAALAAAAAAWLYSHLTESHLINEF